MFWLLFLLFVAVPTVELALLVKIGQTVGLLPTVALVLGTGALGAWLARRQGLGVLGTVRTELAAGRMPASALGDGILILFAAAVLLTPGVLTDVVGFLCLVPAVRGGLKRWLWNRFQTKLQRGEAQVIIDVRDYRTAPDGEGGDGPPSPPRALPPGGPES